MADSSVGCAVDVVNGQADATLLVRDSLDDAPAHRILDEVAQHLLVLAMVEGVEVLLGQVFGLTAVFSFASATSSFVRRRLQCKNRCVGLMHAFEWYSDFLQ